MPKRKKETIKIELENESGETEEFEFLPIGPTGVLPILREEAGLAPEKVSKAEGNRSLLKNYSIIYSDKISSRLLKRCTSHKIVDPETASDKEMQEADYWTTDFTDEEQTNIILEIQGIEDFEQGIEEAENFQDDSD